MGKGIYGALLLSGFVGSVGHCLGMCGPLVLMVGLQFRTRKLSAFLHHLLYHAARVMVYGLLGAVVGAIGSLLGLGGQLSHLGGIVSLVLSLGVILVGVGYLGWLPLGRLESGGEWLTREMSRTLQRGGLWGTILLGGLNGLLPCGLVYSALLLAATTGRALPSAVGMVLFGIGTVPTLVIVGIGAGALSVRLRQALTRVAGVVIVVAGLQLALRGLAALAVVPHLQLGALVIW
jgi:sulfite exporter TauE/SafE